LLLWSSVNLLWPLSHLWVCSRSHTHTHTHTHSRSPPHDLDWSITPRGFARSPSLRHAHFDILILLQILQIVCLRVWRHSWEKRWDESTRAVGWAEKRPDEKTIDKYRGEVRLDYDEESRWDKWEKTKWVVLRQDEKKDRGWMISESLDQTQVHSAGVLRSLL